MNSSCSWPGSGGKNFTDSLNSVFAGPETHETGSSEHNYIFHQVECELIFELTYFWLVSRRVLWLPAKPEEKENSIIFTILWQRLTHGDGSTIHDCTLCQRLDGSRVMWQCCGQKKLASVSHCRSLHALFHLGLIEGGMCFIQTDKLSNWYQLIFAWILRPVCSCRCVDVQCYKHQLHHQLKETKQSVGTNDISCCYQTPLMMVLNQICLRPFFFGVKAFTHRWREE